MRPERGPLPDEDMSEYLFVRQGWVPPSGLAMPASLAKQIAWDETLLFADDSDFTVRLANADAEFYMHPEPLVILDDDERPDRLSHQTDWRATKRWLDRIRPLITRRAYLCYLGSHIARQAAQAGDAGIALRFYLRGVLFMPAPLRAKARWDLGPRRLVKRVLLNCIPRLSAGR
jgi:hypothetical protein